MVSSNFISGLETIIKPGIKFVRGFDGKKTEIQIHQGLIIKILDK